MDLTANIALQVYELVKNDPERKDYTVHTLSKLLSKHQSEISRNAEKYVGHYKIGKQHRFHWQTIDYNRMAGLNILRKI